MQPFVNPNHANPLSTPRFDDESDDNDDDDEADDEPDVRAFP